jgi:FkbM family methyltransferase
MKSIIKSIIVKTGWIFNKLLNNFIGQRFADAILKFKVEENRKIQINKKDIYLSTPNFLLRYRHKTFFSKEPETLNWIDGFKPNSVFFDIGANVGLYSIYATLTRESDVYAFEPSFFNLEFLARNIAINALSDKINVLPIALNDKNGLNDFNLTSTEWGGALSTFEKNFDDSGNEMQPEFIYKTIGFSLDSIVKILNISQPVYIKIDVDGLEHIILSGAKEVLKDVKEILVEINDNFYIQSENTKIILTDLNFYLDQKIYTEKVTKQVANQIWKKKNN